MTLPVSQDLSSSCSLFHWDFFAAAPSALSHEFSSEFVGFYFIFFPRAGCAGMRYLLCVLQGRELLRGLWFTSWIMQALFGCPSSQPAPLKGNRKVKEMRHSEHKCHSAQEEWEKGEKKELPGEVSQGKPEEILARVCWSVPAPQNARNSFPISTPNLLGRGWSWALAAGAAVGHPRDALEKLGSAGNIQEMLWRSWILLGTSRGCSR